MKWLKESREINKNEPLSACIFNICLNRKGPCKSLCYAFACVGSRFCPLNGKQCIHYSGK